MPCPRIGHIDFLNVLPLSWNWEHGAADGLAITRNVPAVLNAALVRGELDVSNVSSILYARHARDLVILPDLCVSTDGPVQSILLVSKKPIEELTTERIVLTAQSQTSHCLLKIILHRSYGATPAYDIRSIEPQDPIPEDAAGSLFIGDNALWLYHHRQPDLYYYDLGAEWKKLTGKKMVYALWCANRTFAEQHPDALRLAWTRIHKGLKNGFAHKEEAITSILGKKPFTKEQLDPYLGPTIRWSLTPDYIEGLKLFYHLACEEGLIESEPELRIVAI